MAPRYNPRAAKAIGFLKKQFNDIEIFVEDTGNRNMWLLIIRKLLPSSIRLKSINMLGGRDRVVSACALDQDYTDPRRRLYITDGDFDFLIGKRKLKLSNYCRLNAYCIENILINEATLLESGLGMQPKADEARIASLIDFDFIETEFNKLRPLFVVYALARLASERIKTVGFDFNKLMTNTDSGVVIDRKKVFNRLREVLQCIKSIKTHRWIMREIKKIKNRAKKFGNEKVISGKDYLFCFLAIHLRARLKYRGDNEQLKVHLASCWQMSPEPNLAMALRRAAL